MSATASQSRVPPRLSAPRTLGRVSGLGCGAGYLGGIVLLAGLVLFASLMRTHGADGTHPHRPTLR